MRSAKAATMVLCMMARTRPVDSEATGANWRDANFGERSVALWSMEFEVVMASCRISPNSTGGFYGNCRLAFPNLMYRCVI